MGAKSSAGSFTDDKEYELMEAGVYPARCIMVVETGTHKNDHPQAAPDAVNAKIIIAFEVSGEKMQDGRPFVISKEYTNSLGDKANLCKDLSAWRGRKFTDEEKQCFELKKILDAPCMLNIAKVAAKKDATKFYNNLLSIMPLMKGMTLEPRVNELVDFGIDDRHDEALLAKLWPSMRKKIAESYEGKGLPIPGQEAAAPKQEEENPNDFGGEIPFS